MLLALMVLAARAAEEPVAVSADDDVGFFLTLPRARLDVTRYTVPALPPTTGERVCTYELVAQGGLDVGWSVAGCPDALAPAMEEALSAWSMALSGPAPAGILLRLSVVAPAPDDPRTAAFLTPMVVGGVPYLEAPAAFVRPSEQWCGTTPMFDMFIGSDHVDCVVSVEVDWFGVPAPGAVSGCDARHHDQARHEALQKGGPWCPLQVGGVVSPWTDRVHVQLHASPGARPAAAIELRSGFPVADE